MNKPEISENARRRIAGFTEEFGRICRRYGLDLVIDGDMVGLRDQLHAAPTGWPLAATYDMSRPLNQQEPAIETFEDWQPARPVMYPIDEPQKTIRLHSRDLFNKWGFSDGALLADFVTEQRIGIDPHAALVIAVRMFLLPALSQQVDCYEIFTSHNPIRASLVIDTYERLGQVTRSVSPEYVDVDKQELLEVLRREA